MAIRGLRKEQVSLVRGKLDLQHQETKMNPRQAGLFLEPAEETQSRWVERNANRKPRGSCQCGAFAVPRAFRAA